MMRGELLTQWVEQPPATPIVQYLRDAERDAAVEQLQSAGRTLDVASESSVTTALSAERITRLDFSPRASERAREILGDTVDQFAVTEPQNPTLDFDKNAFDTAISIGPYDWKFLDVAVLTDELHRVVDSGPVVLSVPTVRSPYASMDANRDRYYTLDEISALIYPEWRLLDADLVFQYPHSIHSKINRLPPRLQSPFVDLSEQLTSLLTERDWCKRAAYIVLSIAPIPYEAHLESAIECLLRPVESNGFWDTDEEKILRALDYQLAGAEITWTPDDDIQWRYAPFALMGLTHWRDSSLGHDAHDQKIRRELEYFAERVTDPETRAEMPSYGLGPLIASFARAGDRFDDEYTSIARDLFEYTSERFNFDHAEDSLLAFGWAHLYERAPDDDLRSALEEALWQMNERLTPDGVFEFENHTTRRHQNQMYTLWGLCRAIDATGLDGYLDSAERVLDYAIDVRMRDDGAFIWEDVPYWRRAWREAQKYGGRRPPHWDFLYECHQTFFVNAVAEYYRAGGEREYTDTVGTAMNWIYGDNSLGRDLVEMSGLGVPMRQMTVDGRMDVPDQMYKGAYEIGSYIMAVTNILDGPIR
jgi:hypothetical protein